MPIPKVISYCWFGDNPLPERAKKCIESWKKFCPDYEIIQWNEENYDVNKIPYIRDANKEKKWAFVSDYARLDIIYEHGGIYLDTDVELVRSLDALLDCSAFLSIDKEDFSVNTGLGFGAEARNPLIKKLLSAYDNAWFIKEDGSLNLKACPAYSTEVLEKLGYVREDKSQNIEGANILSSDYFCPMNFKDGSLNKTENTIGNHWYEASWFSKDDKIIHDKEVFFNRKYPIFISRILSKGYRLSYRLIQYTKDGTLIDRIMRKW